LVSARFGNEFPSVQDFMTEAHIYKQQLQLAMMPLSSQIDCRFLSIPESWNGSCAHDAMDHDAFLGVGCNDQGGGLDTSVPRITLG
jgi:hypothetical protein